jgi:hypothetical protein
MWFAKSDPETNKQGGLELVCKWKERKKEREMRKEENGVGKRGGERVVWG